MACNVFSLMKSIQNCDIPFTIVALMSKLIVSSRNIIDTSGDLETDIIFRNHVEKPLFMFTLNLHDARNKAS